MNDLCQFSSALAVRDWPHSPAHRLNLPGTYIVTGGTYGKLSFFNTPTLLTYLTNLLLDLAEAHGWTLQAWAIFANHYHFMGESPRPQSLRRLTKELHGISAREINLRQSQPGRKVWFQYWDSQITFHRSFLARLNYVHQNPVYHRVVRSASQYAWCSAGWFERKASPAFVKTVRSFPTDQLAIPDEFEVLPQP